MNNKSVKQLLLGIAIILFAMVMVLVALLFLLLSAAVYLNRTAIGPVSPESYYFLLAGMVLAGIGLGVVIRGYRRVD